MDEIKKAVSKWPNKGNAATALSGIDSLVQRTYNIRALPVTLTKTSQSEVSDSVDAEAGAKVKVSFVAI